MRKRDRDRIAKQLNGIAHDIHNFGTQQLFGSAWYFQNNSKGKGLNFGYEVKRNLEELNKRLTEILEKAHQAYTSR